MTSVFCLGLVLCPTGALALHLYMGMEAATSAYLPKATAAQCWLIGGEPTRGKEIHYYCCYYYYYHHHDEAMGKV